MSPDDPDMLKCTCVHRKVTLQEVVIFIRPNHLGSYAFARDCPVHGCWFEWTDEMAKSEINHPSENLSNPVAPDPKSANVRK